MEVPYPIRSIPAAALLLLAVWAPPLHARPDGREIYAAHCAGCHGENGEGGTEEAPDPLHGRRSAKALSSYIERQMPEEDPSLVVGADAVAVAAYIHETFYSAEARARSTDSPPPRAFARLTNRQFRESVADLFASFGEVTPPGEGRGLAAQYFESNGMNKKAKKVLEREDYAVDFDFGEGAPVEGTNAEQFSIAWDGSLRVSSTGWHEFRVSTPNGVRLYLNGERQEGEGNRRDDSAARRQPALIDEWVSSGDEVREASAHVFLLGGRSYPIRLDYFKYKERRGMVRLEWKAPLGEWTVLAAPHLSPAPANHVTVVTTAFPPDDASEGYERGTEISKAWHDAVAVAAVEVSNLAVARLGRLSGSHEKDAGHLERLKDFAATLASRAFRRSLSEEERNRLLGAAFAPGVASEDAVKRAVILILTSPRFLYPELGGAADDFTVATRLALGMWDSLPDDELFAAAANGRLWTSDEVRAQAARMMEDPRARAKIDHFLHRWLKLDLEGELRKNQESHPGFDGALVDDLRRSLHRFIDHVVWENERSDYRELLTADYLFVNERLSGFYGLPAPESEGFHRVAADPAQRAGVISHPYLLARLAHFDVTSPIHRGVFLTRHVLGGVLRPPPEAIAFNDSSFDPHMTTREKVAEMTKEPSCMSCHETINPLGFALENFDAAGRHRLIERERKIDASSEFVTMEGLHVHLRGPRDVAEMAANSEVARQGFVRQMFRHVVQQNPGAYGADTVSLLDRSFVESDHHIRHLFVAINTLAALHGLPHPEQANR